MRTDETAYMFNRARQEAEKANEAAERGACEAEVAAHKELAIRYKVRALSQCSGVVPSIDAVPTGSRNSSRA